MLSWGFSADMSFVRLQRRPNSSTEKAMKTEVGRTRSSLGRAAGSDAIAADRDVEVGALGLLMYQAAREGSSVGLRFALSCRGGKLWVPFVGQYVIDSSNAASDHINYQDSTTQMVTVIKLPPRTHSLHVSLQKNTKQLLTLFFRHR